MTTQAAHPHIEEKARRIGQMVTQSLEMAIFKQAERDLQNHADAQSLLQQLQEGGEESHVEHLLDLLEQLDVVRRFTIAQENLSEVIAHVTRILTATVSDRLDLVLGSSGCGNCPATGCSGNGTGTSAECGGTASSCSH